jgi:hypothetical protein
MSNGIATAAARCSLLIAIVSATSTLLYIGAAQAQVATYTVETLKKANTNFVVDLSRTPKGGGKPVQLNKTVSSGASTSDAAANIVTAFGDGVKIDPKDASKVRFDPAANGFAEAKFTGSSNEAVVYNIGTSFAFLPPPDTALADLVFLPNLSNGSNILANDSLITAGFASGLSPVSFTATAGLDLDQLASMLDSALMIGGYLTSMPDPTDVVVFAQGTSSPVEVNFGINPLGIVGPDGDIEIAASVSVPEPSSFTLLLAGAAAMGLLLRHSLFGARTIQL